MSGSHPALISGGYRDGLYRTGAGGDAGTGGDCSCGSGPDGIRATTFNVAGSTIETVRSALESTNNEADGVLCPYKPPPTHATRSATTIGEVISFSPDGA